MVYPQLMRKQAVLNVDRNYVDKTIERNNNVFPKGKREKSLNLIKANQSRQLLLFINMNLIKIQSLSRCNSVQLDKYFLT